MELFQQTLQQTALIIETIYRYVYACMHLLRTVYLAEMNGVLALVTNLIINTDWFENYYILNDKIGGRILNN